MNDCVLYGKAQRTSCCLHLHGGITVPPRSCPLAKEGWQRECSTAGRVIPDCRATERHGTDHEGREWLREYSAARESASSAVRARWRGHRAEAFRARTFANEFRMMTVPILAPAATPPDPRGDAV